MQQSFFHMSFNMTTPMPANWKPPKKKVSGKQLEKKDANVVAVEVSGEVNGPASGQANRPASGEANGPPILSGQSDKTVLVKSSKERKRAQAFLRETVEVGYSIIHSRSRLQSIKIVQGQHQVHYDMSHYTT
jgi:hypothetical protein